MNTSNILRYRLSGPADLPAVTAYLLGYQPSPGSIAALAVHNARIQACLGIDAQRIPPQPEAITAVADELAAHATTNNWTLILLFYGNTSQTGHRITTILQHLHHNEIQVAAAYRIGEKHLHCLLCGGCDHDITAYDITTSAFSATAAYAGMPNPPDRATIAAQYAPITGTRRHHFDNTLKQALQRHRSLTASDGGNPAGQTSQQLHLAGTTAVDDAIAQTHTGELIDDHDAAWLLLLLQHLPVRDHAWTTGNSLPAQRLWAHLTRLAPPAFAAPPACLLAINALTHGDHLTANIALERAQHADPTYSLTHILTRAIHARLTQQQMRDLLTFNTETPPPAQN
ncbi:DUF4192 domain-containing protein [Catelliglobosispora koreensis]|uniref:DUF4192 domain-containing protein n=1 Tax=Catelliglobosispora koreensis TaxID=129052 RepID=UPI000361DB7D|nr:DUF4192 domain-containing protein [Catelliglobosispora koreensis]